MTQAAEELTSFEVQPSDYTSKNHITLADTYSKLLLFTSNNYLDVTPRQADCAIIVLAADDLGHGISAKDISGVPRNWLY